MPLVARQQCLSIGHRLRPMAADVFFLTDELKAEDWIGLLGQRERDEVEGCDAGRENCVGHVRGVVQCIVYDQPCASQFPFTSL